MTSDQWNVLGLLLVLFALELVRNKNIYNWLVTALNQISGAVAGSGNGKTSYTPPTNTGTQPGGTVSV